MNLGINNKVALVSGGSKGIGRACSEMLAQAGCRVMVAARGIEAIEKTVADIVNAGGRAEGVSADLTVEEQIGRAVEATRRHFGDPDIVIANVEAGDTSDFLADDPAAFTDAYQRLAMSVVHLARATFPAMQQKQWGRMLTISTVAAKEPAPGLRLMAANTARAGVVNLSKSLADEFAPSGITVNTLAPGWIQTDAMMAAVGQMAEAVGTDVDNQLKRLSRGIPVKHLGKPEDVAAIAAFLCSDLAGYITGCFIPVDGGSHRGAA